MDRINLLWSVKKVQNCTLFTFQSFNGKAVVCIPFNPPPPQPPAQHAMSNYTPLVVVVFGQNVCSCRLQPAAAHWLPGPARLG